METYADEVSSLKEQLLNIANTQVNGTYLFAGFADDSEPFASSPVVYNGTSDIKYVESGPGETIATNIPGDTLFTTPVDVFAELDNLEISLRAEDTSALESSLDTLEVAADQIRTQRSLMGNNSARLDDSKSMLEDAKVQTQSTLSRYEDADLTEVISEMTQAEQALEAALTVSSRITNLSLLNYL
jgi:flagellar hook-associated protein 3 FlgL